MIYSTRSAHSCHLFAMNSGNYGLKRTNPFQMDDDESGPVQRI